MESRHTSRAGAHAPSWRVATTSFWRVACSSTLLDMRLYSVSTCSPRCACVLCAWAHAAQLQNASQSQSNLVGRAGRLS